MDRGLIAVLQPLLHGFSQVSSWHSNVLSSEEASKEVQKTEQGQTQSFYNLIWHFISRGQSVVKNPPAMQEAYVRSLGQEDPREEGMTTHSSILARSIPWTEEPGGLPSMGSQKVRHDWSNWAWTESKKWHPISRGQCGTIGKEPAYQCRRCKTLGFNPWVRKIPWRMAQQPTPVFLPGKSHVQRSLIGCSPVGRKKSDTTEAT